MKQKFSTAWKSSIRPGKQRKYLANAPLHIKRKLLSCSLSKELRKKQGRRSAPLRKGDEVKIMKGKFKKKQAKIIEIRSKTGKIYIEGMQVKKQDGSKVNIPFRAPNLQIINLNMDDKMRFPKRQEKSLLGKKPREETEKKHKQEAKK